MKENPIFFKTCTGQLITLNIVVFLVMYFYNFYVEQDWDLSERTIQQFGALHPHTSPWYTVITTMFLHGGIAHILCNSISLKTVGENLENVAGKWFLPVYLISGVVSGLGVYFFATDWTVGASGAICGIWAMLIVYEIKYRENRKGNIIFITTAIDLGLMIYISSLPKVSAIGHFSGFMTGLVFGLIYFFFFYEEPLEENFVFKSLESSDINNQQSTIILPGAKDFK